MMNKPRSIMIQGTASSVGKSLLVAALCRVFVQDGYRTAPFKSQNMALNSFITEEGLEMGRAQVMQAEAAKIKPQVAMNPILLKPSTDQAAQVIIMGKALDHMSAADYHQMKPQLKGKVKVIFQGLQREYPLVVIEGAGSPAEINLMEHDLVNMGMAEIADAPVILVGDIDRGGVFASLYGTVMLLEEAQRRRIKGIIINKFRGDIKILEPGLKMLEEKIGIPVLGVIPYCNINLEDEDSVTDRFKKRSPQGGEVKIRILKLPYISNFTDFHIFDTISGVDATYVQPGESIGEADLIILPGSKSTMADLRYLRESGLAAEILAAHEKGTLVMGICGGFQMLGKTLADPAGVEGSIQEAPGLGLLDIETVFEPEKVTTQVMGEINMDALPALRGNAPLRVKGYEIHMGRSRHGAEVKPLLRITQRLGKPVSTPEGAVSKDGRVMGTYLHGIFDEVDFTRALLQWIHRKKGLGERTWDFLSLQEFKEQEYDRLAQIFRDHVDMAAIYRILEEWS